MSKKIYKYTITVFSTSDQASNMLLDTLGGGDEYASDIELEECDESDLPKEVKVIDGPGIGRRRIVSADYEGY